MSIDNYLLDKEYIAATDPARELVWISASAGTGKTRLLVQRVLRLLMYGHRNILCITFTNSAAHEIRERIYDVTKEWLYLPDDELSSTVEKTCYKKATNQLRARARGLFLNIHNLLKVQTVHGFCRSLISTFPIETGISPDFLIRDPEESYQKIFLEMLKNSQEIAAHLSQISSELKENTLYDVILKIISKNRDLIPLETEPVIPEISPYSIQCPMELIEALESGGIQDKKVSTKLRSWQSTEKPSINQIEQYLSIFIDKASLSPKNISSISSKAVLNRFPFVEKTILEEQEKLLEFAEKFYTARILKRTFHVVHIARYFLHLYSKDKETFKYLDHSDIITTALKLLSDPAHRDWVLLHLDSKIDHVLVDESQDNSLEQWHIIAILCEEFFAGLSTNNVVRTLFVVGDVKQSIYGFQNARPDYFHYMHQYFLKKSNNSISVHLGKSFRSTPAILSLVDKVFNNLRVQVSFESKEIKHTANRTNDYGYVEVWPILSSRHEKSYAWDMHNMSHENTTDSLLLAQTIAHTIHTWIRNGRILASQNRPVEASDILILVRHRSIFVDQVVSELKRVDIPTLGRDRFNILDHTVVQDLINLGEFLLLPENDFALATLLKSPMFECTDETLFAIVSNNKDSSLWKKLQQSPQADFIVAHLRYLQSIAKTHNPLDLYTVVLSHHKEKFLKYLGKSAADIMEEFINLTIKFLRNNPGTLESFVHWVKNTNPVAKSDIGTAQSRVRIMTVHGAKGMQSPIVFLPDTTSIPKCDTQVIFDEQNSPFWCANNEGNAHCIALKTQKKHEEYNEYLRLLYVALTRAADELYISGTGTPYATSWYNIITNSGSELFRKRKCSLSPMFTDPVEIMYIKDGPSD